MNAPDTIKQRFLPYIEHAARQSLIDEVSATPKPGLVDLSDSGAHKDMDFSTFFASTEAISPWILKMAELGFDWADKKDKEGLFAALRPVGMAAEKAMFEATKGVNTHKGMIFSMGLTAASAGYICALGETLFAERILSFCREMCCQSLEADFSNISPTHPRTHGELLYIKYGCRGIRGEAAEGFPGILKCSLPALKETLTEHGSADWNRICLQVLLRLMAQIDDTNVLFRTDYASLLYVKEQAAHILQLGGGYTENGMGALKALNIDFINKNISPGGCADLLAITLFLWRLEQFV